MRIQSNWFIWLIAALLSPTGVANAGETAQPPQVGDTYKITWTRHSVEQSGNRSSGSSNDKNTLIERVTAVRADGLELQYDLPDSATANERARTWQFPVRVFKTPGGAVQLLNRPELEARLEGWLEAAKLPRSACGHWIFTWTAVRIECDPQSALQAIQSFDLGPGNIREGGLYEDSNAISPGKLTRKSSAVNGDIFATEMPIDANAVRRARAESDVVVGEILKTPVSLEAALQERAREVISGTISVAIETDSAGNVRRRTKVTKLETMDSAGHSETQTTTDILERRQISGRE